MKSQTQVMEWIVYVENSKKKIAFRINYYPIENQYSITGMYSYGGKWLEFTNIKYEINKFIYKHIDNDKCVLMNITKETVAELILAESQKIKYKINEFKKLSEILDKDFDIVEVDMGDLTTPETKEPILKNVTDVNDMFENFI